MRDFADGYHPNPLTPLRAGVIRNVGDQCESTIYQYELFWFGVLLWKCLLDSSETWEYALNYEIDNECGWAAPLDMKYCEQSTLAIT
jgi:hypothetical protein